MRAALWAVLCLLFVARGVRADDDPLLGRIVEQIGRGEPVIIQVHVALCDNSVIHCGGHGLGDGDSLRTNLYWSTSEGLRGWLGEQPTGWKLVVERKGAGDRLAESIWHRRVTPAGVLRAAGVTTPFDAYLVIDAWRGTRIDAAVDAFVTDVFGDRPREHTIPTGTLRAGGAAAVVAWVGHNRFMDYTGYSWTPALARRGAPKGVVAIACYSREYLKAPLLRGGHVPLILTNDFVMASGAPLVGAVNALLDGSDRLTQRKEATLAYARSQKKDPARISKVFTNATSPNW